VQRKPAAADFCTHALIDMTSDGLLD